MVCFWFSWVYPSKRMDCQLVKNRVSHYHSDATFASAQIKKESKRQRLALLPETFSHFYSSLAF